MADPGGPRVLPLSTEGDGGPVRVGELVEEVLDRAGVREQIARNAALEDWEERVGEAIARVTRARRVSGATLIVEVASSAWLMELDMMKREIMARINAGRKGGRIERLVFVLAENP